MAAADYAISIATQYNTAELIVLPVLPTGIKREYFDYKPEDIPVWIRENLLQYRHEVEEWFNRIREKYLQQEQKLQQHNETTNSNLKIEMVNRMTSISGTIVSYAEEEGTDLIVLGTKGMSGVKRMLLGSVSQEVVMYAHCPVLVVRRIT
jgi:nucleotide-binding universal stress UspA family protein